MNKDQIKGRIKKAKGVLKETAGRITGNVELQKKGRLLKTAGRGQAGYGDIKNESDKE